MNELQHHGIKGMKWGVRRFENKDGSLTPAGKKRYNEDGSKKTRSEKKAYKAEVKQANKTAKIEAKELKKANYTKGQVRARGALKAVGTYALTQNVAVRLALSGKGSAAAALNVVGTVKTAQILWDAHKDVKAIKEREQQ